MNSLFYSLLEFQIFLYLNESKNISFQKRMCENFMQKHKILINTVWTQVELFSKKCLSRDSELCECSSIQELKEIR
jgi:hypothetical protein